MSDDQLLRVDQCDRGAAVNLLLGKLVGGGDGGTYVVNTPTIAQATEAFAKHRLAALRLQSQPGDVERVAFQNRVDTWMDACFGDTIKADRLERCDRFIEEALELVQTEPTFTADRAHALV